MIEYNQPEMVEPVPTPEPPPPAAPEAPHRHDRPSPHDIVVGALAQALPCPVCGRTEPCRCARPEGYSPTEARARLIVEALALFGHLPPLEEEGAFDPEEVAQWLAERSGFPRYTQAEDGWRKILESERDVELAAIKAMQRVPSDEVEIVKGAKASLLAWHQSRTV